MNIPHIISAAEVSGADAIHPGYGFLAENASFAEVCETSGITFIGPRSELIGLMGEKDRARQEMVRAGLSVLPGSEGVVRSESEARSVAAQIGYPLMIKAAAGGGGRGMRVVWKESELSALLATAQHETQQAFGTPDVYLERFLPNPRHVEFQVLGDRHGNVIHLGERDCSIQRRHQKMVEESPSPAVSEETRRRMGEQVMAAMRAIGYSNAGTIEFLLDEEGNFYFIEMNTRIQVEHPVTEMVTGVDLIKEQIRVAAGESLPLKQDEVALNGWAIEARINAEDPSNGFAPCPGRISEYQPPGGPGVRLDTHVFAGYDVPPFYDSLLAKLITFGQTREDAIRVMQRALEEFLIEPIRTTIPLHKQIFSDPTFWRGQIATNYIDRKLQTGEAE